MRATLLIEQQHRQVEGLFETLENNPADAQALNELAVSLAAHAAIEEEVFYPAGRKAEPELILESLEEHELMAHELSRLVACDPKDESFRAKLTTLKEVVERHVQEEEQDLLEKVGKAVGEREDESLGDRMEARFAELSALGYEKILRGKKEGRSPKRAADGGREATGAKTSEKKGQTTKPAARKKTAQGHRKAA